MGGDDDEDREAWRQTTKPDNARDPHFRLGLLIRNVADLSDRVTALEQAYDLEARARRSMRPKVQAVGLSVIVSGIVAGIVQGVAQLAHFLR